MANSESIKKYLIEGNKSYLDNDDNNGTMLMLSGVWGSGKTHFWKNIIETDLIPKIKAKEKSYVFVSLYGKDSIEELQNEILQKSYSFVHHQNTDIISQTYSVFTKMTSLMPKITVLGVGIDATNTGKQIEELNNNEKLKKGTDALLNGGIICFDDFERKSSKIDLNDLFGFITNLTENFQTKTIIILNQEFFQDHDTKVFNTVKEKSVNKFILYNPSIKELFEVIYEDKDAKYKRLDQYKVKILEAIQLSEEKNARIYIQVLNNCLEYTEKVKEINNRAIYLLTLTTIIFVKHNLVLRMVEYDKTTNLGIHANIYFLPDVIDKIPSKIVNSIFMVNHQYENISNMESFIDLLHQAVTTNYEIRDSTSSSKVIQAPTNLLDKDLDYIAKNNGTLFTIYKYCLEYQTFAVEEISLLEKINNFVESGILLEE
jgi:hypothetical protein